MTIEPLEAPEPSARTWPRLPVGGMGVSAAVLLASWAAAIVGMSQLQAAIAALLSVATMAYSLRLLGLHEEGAAVAPAPYRVYSRADLKLDIALAVAVMLVAAMPRLIALGDLPKGFQNDEGVAGMEARRIREDGPIGPFSDEAAGVPAGTFYWTAVVTAVAGDGVTTVRLSYALIGIATVGMLFAAARVAFGRQVAVIAALFLAVSVWHVLYSRVAFIPIGLPFFELLSFACLGLAMRTRSLLWAAAGGLAAGACVYMYQGYPMVFLGFSLALFSLAVFCYRERLAWFRNLAAVFVLFGVLAVLPMASYAGNHSEQYLTRYRQNNVFHGERFQAAEGLLDKAEVIADKERAFLYSAVVHGALDDTDASGLVPLVDRLSMALIILGVGIAIARWRSPAYLGTLAVCGVILIGPSLVIDGESRRALAATPMLAVFCALPVHLAFTEGRKRLPALGRAAPVLVLAPIAAVALLGLRPYYTEYDSSPAAASVLGFDIMAGFEAVGRLDDDVYIYHYSRVTLGAPVRTYLAPHNPGEERSDWFEAGPMDLQADRSRDVYYLFVEPYLNLVPLVERLYPDGYREDGPEIEGHPAYVGYFLPKQASAGR